MTIGTTIGKTIGQAAAYTAHGAIKAASYTGQFGRDVVEGTRTGYRTKSDELAAARAIGYTPVVPTRTRRVKATA
jgi:hypothetical protein